MADVHVTVDPGFQQTTSAPASKPHWDPSFIKTRPGILKIVQLVLDLIAFFCCIAQYGRGNYSALGFFEFVTMSAFWITLILFIFYLFHVISWLTKVPWMKIEFFYSAIWTLLYLISSIILASFASQHKSTGAAQVACAFGFFATAAYGIEAFFKFRGWRAGDKCQED